MVDFTNGFANGMVSNNTTLPNGASLVRRVTPSNGSEALGQTAANFVSIVQGGAEFLGGGTAALGGGAVSLSGVGAVVGVPAMAGGVAVAGHGLNTANNAIRNLFNNDNNGRYNASSNGGRSGKAQRLKDLAKDDKLGSADRGWIKQEQNSVARGSKRMGEDGVLRPQKNIRNPPGKDLAHPRGQRASQGFDYRNAKLQGKDLHRLEHKHEGYK